MHIFFHSRVETFFDGLLSTVSLLLWKKLDSRSCCKDTCLHTLPFNGFHILPFNGFFPGLPGWAGTRKVKPIWILLKLETVSGNGISWAICKSAPHSRQITTLSPHHSVFYRPDALPASQPTASKHWRHLRYLLKYISIPGDCFLCAIFARYWFEWYCLDLCGVVEHTRSSS